MADDFDWAERLQFLFCLVARAFALRRSASLPEQVSTSPAKFSFFFFFLPPLADDISLGAKWEYVDGGVPAVPNKKRNAALEGRTCQKGVDLRGPQLVGCHRSALPSAAQRNQAVPQEQRTSRPVSSFRRASHLPAGFHLRC